MLFGKLLFRDVLPVCGGAGALLYAAWGSAFARASARLSPPYTFLRNEPTGRGYLRPVEEVLDGFRSLWQGIEEVANGFAFGS